jgi:hypothetical protein
VPDQRIAADAPFEHHVAPNHDAYDHAGNGPTEPGSSLVDDHNHDDHNDNDNHDPLGAHFEQQAAPESRYGRAGLERHLRGHPDHRHPCDP